MYSAALDFSGSEAALAVGLVEEKKIVFKSYKHYAYCSLRSNYIPS